jgi:hypothetical protein
VIKELIVKMGNCAACDEQNQFEQSQEVNMMKKRSKIVSGS